MARHSIACVCSILFLAGATPALGQTSSEKIDRFVPAIVETEKSAAHAQENLLQMGRGLRGGDQWRAIGEIVDAYGVVRAQLYAVPLIGALSSGMACRSDRERVIEVFIASAQAAYAIAGVSLRTINEAMPRLTDPAVVSEAATLRDGLLRERDLLESLGPAISQ